MSTALMVIGGYFAIGLFIGTIWTALAEDRWDVWLEGAPPIFQIIGIAIFWGFVLVIGTPFMILEWISGENR